MDNYSTVLILFACNLMYIVSMGVFDWSSSVTYVLTDWTCLTILYSSGTGNEAM